MRSVLPQSIQPPSHTPTHPHTILAFIPRDHLKRQQQHKLYVRERTDGLHPSSLPLPVPVHLMHIRQINNLCSVNLAMFRCLVAEDGCSLDPLAIRMQIYLWEWLHGLTVSTETEQQNVMKGPQVIKGKRND